MPEHEKDLPIEETTKNHPKVLRRLRRAITLHIIEQLYPKWQPDKEPMPDEVMKLNDEIQAEVDKLTTEEEILALPSKYNLPKADDTHIEISRALARSDILRNYEEK